jgi:hypothetical protein
MGHHRARLSPKHRQQVVHQPPLYRFARNRSHEHVEVANLANAAQHLLRLHAIHHFLDGGVSGPLLLSKGLLHLANGRLASSPKRLHDLNFKLGQARSGHLRLRSFYLRHVSYITYGETPSLSRRLHRLGRPAFTQSPVFAATMQHGPGLDLELPSARSPWSMQSRGHAILHVCRKRRVKHGYPRSDRASTGSTPPSPREHRQSKSEGSRIGRPRCGCC